MSSALAGVADEVIGRAERDLAAAEALEERKSEIRRELAQVGLAPELEEVFRNLEQPIQQWEDQLEDLARLPSLEALQGIVAGLEALERALIAATEGVRDDEILDLLAHVLDATLVRFQPRQGMLPVRAVPSDTEKDKPHLVLTTGDKRPWSDASTGQKAQLALAFMLAQASALRDRLPARVLVLDDTSTAFDQANLARQVTWLRQLAYHPEPDKRWQVFLASHHDELTSRLAEALLPPEGCSQLVLEFTGWRPDYGPEITRWETEIFDPRWPGEPHERLERAIGILWNDVPLGGSDGP